MALSSRKRESLELAFIKAGGGIGYRDTFHLPFSLTLPLTLFSEGRLQRRLGLLLSISTFLPDGAGNVRTVDSGNHS